MRGFPGGASSKEPTYQRRRHEPWVRSLGWEDTLEKGMATHSSIFPWRSPWTEQPGGLHTVHSVAQSWTWLKQLSTHAGTGEIPNEAQALQGPILTGQSSAELGFHPESLAQGTCWKHAIWMVWLCILDLPLASMWPWQISHLFTDSIQGGNQNRDNNTNRTYMPGNT